MNSISINDMQSCNQNDYPHHLRQINIFEEWYESGIQQSNWYVVSIYNRKEPNAVYNTENMGFGI